jgi:Fructose/tagatose bisphosphate aldolase
LAYGETIEYLRKALQIGFTGVMIDASTLFYKEKVRLMKETVSLVSLYGADIEAELGSIGVRETGEGNSSGADDSSKFYTNRSLAGQFVKETGICALACSFGTTHGIKLSELRLDFDVVSGVRKAGWRAKKQLFSYRIKESETLLRDIFPV